MKHSGALMVILDRGLIKIGTWYAYLLHFNLLLVVKKFGIEGKVFKIVGDSASNNKKAFKNQSEALDESHILAKLVLKQKKRDLYFERLALQKHQEIIAVISKTVLVLV